MADIHQMNGVKNFLALAINGVAAIYFAASGAVLWSDGLAMAAAAICGRAHGASLARRVGRVAVRRFVIGVGFCMAISLFIRRLV